MNTPRSVRTASAFAQFVALIGVLGLAACTGASEDGATRDSDSSSTTIPAAADSSRHADGHAHEHDAATQTASGDDKGLSLLENGEMAHHYGADKPLSAKARARLAHQLSLTTLIADRFPTLKDAKAAGSRTQGAFGPGLGLHMTMPPVAVEPARSRSAPPPVDGELTDQQIMLPASLMYAGSDDEAALAGFMYYIPSAAEPEGFAGPNDHWHTHSDLCVVMGDKGIKTIHPEPFNAETCAKGGGFFVAQTNFMVHVWTIPDYESPRGVFSDINPAITCSDGTYYTVSKKNSDKYNVNKCRGDAA